MYYAWANNPVGVNLANAAGLQASPLRFGTVPQTGASTQDIADIAARNATSLLRLG